MKRLFVVFFSCLGAVALIGASVGENASSQENRFFIQKNDKIQKAENVVETESAALSGDSSAFRALGGSGFWANLVDGGRRKNDGRRIFESSPFSTADAATSAVETSENVANGFEFELELSVGADEFPLASAPNVASETELSPCCSLWARFAPGSWARLRTTSVAYENGKANQSVTETRITLKNIDFVEKTYELQYDKTIKMGGVDRPRASETARFDFWDVPIDGKTSVETLAPTSLIIARKAIPCQTRRVVRTTANGKETTILWFSPVVAPYVLRKETTCESLTPKSASLSSVGVATSGGNFGTNGGATSASSPILTSTSVPSTVLSAEKSTVQRTAANLLLGGNLSTYGALSSAQNGRLFNSKSSVFSTSTPGGVVRETTVETDENGAVLFQTTTVLLDYYAAY